MLSVQRDNSLLAGIMCLVALVCGVWSISDYMANSDPGVLLIGCVGLMVGFGAAVYEAWGLSPGFRGLWRTTAHGHQRSDQIPRLRWRR